MSDCRSGGIEDRDVVPGLPIIIQIGDVPPETVAHIDFVEGEPIEAFQTRLAAVLLHVALGILTPEES